ncbi:MAG: hypothetical protein ACLVJ8_15065 [Ruthenibacterium lactatiformans]
MVQAEQSVIGCLMMAPSCWIGARGAFRDVCAAAGAYFFLHARAEKAGTPVDAVTVVSGWGTAMRPLSGSARASRRALARSRNTLPSCWTRGGSARW